MKENESWEHVHSGSCLCGGIARTRLSCLYNVIGRLPVIYISVWFDCLLSQPHLRKEFSRLAGDFIVKISSTAEQVSALSKNMKQNYGIISANCADTCGFPVRWSLELYSLLDESSERKERDGWTQSLESSFVQKGSEQKSHVIVTTRVWNPDPVWALDINMLAWHTYVKKILLTWN